MTTAEKEPATLVKLVIAPSRMEVRAHWQASVPAEQVLTMLKAQFAAHHLPWSADEAMKVRIQGAAAHPNGTRETVLLTGTPAAPPQDESLQWARDFFRTDFQVDAATGRMDYRQRMASENVKAGELLATLMPGVAGAPGADVYGKSVPARSPHKLAVRMGKNVVFDKTKATYTAACAGRIRWGGNLLAVDSDFIAPEDIGLASGNVTFPGHVTVPHDIEDLAVVHADGGIKVGNCIGEARVSSGGDIVVAHGIAAKGKGHIEAAAGVCSGYITNANVQCGGDVIVRVEIIQSCIRTLGGVRVEHGRIVGGEIIALGQVMVNEAGSESGVKTIIVAGEDHSLRGFMTETRAELAKIQGEADKLREQVAGLKAQTRQMTAQQREMLMDLMFQLQEADDKVAEFTQRMDHRLADSEHRSCKRIRIGRIAYPGVTFRIGGVAMELTEPLRGPMTLVPDLSLNQLKMRTR